MPSYRKVLTVIMGLSMVGGCTEGEAAKANDVAKLSPEVFSHGDPVAISDQPCLAPTGVLITAASIRPVTVSTPWSRLRQRCRVAVINVPQALAIQEPLLGVSVTGGSLAFTLAVEHG